MKGNGLHMPPQSNSVYHLLQARETAHRPIRVGVIGAGATGRAIALQLGTPVPGMRLSGIANRTPAHAERALREAAIEGWEAAESAHKAAAAIDRGRVVLTDDPTVLTRCSAIDIIVEVTGSVDFGASVVLDAFAHRKPVVLVNAELDSLLGPILKARADEAGVVLTHTDGDEPGVAMTLVRYCQSVGMRPVAAGNIKGMVDYYRNPDTQAAFAKANDQDVRKVTSFADSTKLSMETTVLANATGFGVAKRGMVGPACQYVRELYTPFHLPHIQLPSTIARAVLHSDPTVAPRGGPFCEVVTVAKRALKAGERLDGIGGFTSFGLIDNHAAARATNALPIALSEGCVLLRDIGKDEVLSFNDVRMPALRLSDELWLEQMHRWQAQSPVGLGGVHEMPRVAAGGGH